MENLGDKVLQKIKKEHIVPRPRWQFLLKNYFIWLVFLVSLLLGSIAFCVALFVFFENDWDLYRYLHTTLVGHVLISIPYIWIGFLILFVWIAYYNFKYTKGGYRRETYFVVVLSVAGSLVIGVALHSLGAGEKIENMVSSSVPFYEKITCCSNRKDIWVQPSLGLLGGTIIEVLDGRDFQLEDFRGTVWQIQENDDTLEYSPLEIKPGEEVKIIGEREQGDLFWAREVRPWKKKGDISRKARERAETE